MPLESQRFSLQSCEKLVVEGGVKEKKGTNTLFAVTTGMYCRAECSRQELTTKTDSQKRDVKRRNCPDIGHYFDKKWKTLDISDTHGTAKNYHS